jgi:GT2 family glycosyltransferase
MSWENNMSLTISIMITTKNRVQELRRTCRVLGQLSPQPLEILITADGCTDGTVFSSMMKAGVRSHRATA